MKRGKFWYTISVEIEFTDEEFNIIRGCMRDHYDGVVKSAVRQGGFVYGWNNMRSVEVPNPITSFVVDSTQLGTCAKALEMPRSLLGLVESQDAVLARFDLRRKIMDALESIENETLRVIKEQDDDECP